MNANTASNKANRRDMGQNGCGAAPFDASASIVPDFERDEVMEVCRAVDGRTDPMAFYRYMLALERDRLARAAWGLMRDIDEQMTGITR